jgi:hypothetical protein
MYNKSCVAADFHTKRCIYSASGRFIIEPKVTWQRQCISDNLVVQVANITQSGRSAAEQKKHILFI